MLYGMVGYARVCSTFCLPYLRCQSILLFLFTLVLAWSAHLLALLRFSLFALKLATWWYREFGISIIYL